MDRSQSQRTFVDIVETQAGLERAEQVAAAESVRLTTLATGDQYNALPDAATTLEPNEHDVNNAHAVATAVEEYSHLGNHTDRQDTMGSAWRVSEDGRDLAFRPEGQARANDAIRALKSGGAIVKITNIVDRPAGQPLTRLSIVMDEARRVDAQQKN